MAYDRNSRRSNNSNGASSSTVYTNANFNFYDGKYSALSGNLAGYNGFLLTFAPIIKDMIGKQPKKGEKVYDYDAKVNVSVNSALALALSKMASLAKETYLNSDSDNDIRRFEHKVDTFNGHRSIQIVLPHAMKLAGEPNTHFIIRVEIVRDETKTVTYHALQEEVIHIHSANGSEELKEYVGLEFLIQLPRLVTYSESAIALHGAKLAGGNRSSSERRAPTGNNIEEEDVDGNSTSSSSSTQGGDDTPVASSLEAEFED